MSFSHFRYLVKWMCFTILPDLRQQPLKQNYLFLHVRFCHGPPNDLTPTLYHSSSKRETNLKMKCKLSKCKIMTFQNLVFIALLASRYANTSECHHRMRLQATLYKRICSTFSRFNRFTLVFLKVGANAYINVVMHMCGDKSKSYEVKWQNMAESRLNH